MDLITLLAISIGLSIDSFSVSFADGIAFPRMKLGRKLLISETFAVIQFSFTAIGWFMAGPIIKYLSHVDYWLAFVLLTYVSIKMVIENEEEENVKCLNFGNIVLQGMATSIDAIIVGFSMVTVWQTIIPQASIVGIVTLIFSLLGFALGKIIGEKLIKISRYFGASILFLLGLKILLEHLLS